MEDVDRRGLGRPRRCRGFILPPEVSAPSCSSMRFEAGMKARGISIDFWRGGGAMLPSAGSVREIEHFGQLENCTMQ